jgi:branched-chain amino acid transport system permease protein
MMPSDAPTWGSEETVLLAVDVPLINENFFNLAYILQLISNGLSNGAIYALMALTVVIIYKTTGHLNFAQGEMAMFSTFIIYALTAGSGVAQAIMGVNVWIALLIAVCIAFFFGAAVERFLVRPVEHKSALAPVIVTLGLFFILNALAATIWGTDPRNPVPQPFPGGLDDKIDILDGPPKFFITYKAIGIWITVGLLVTGLTLLLNKTKVGLAYRGVSANRESSQLVGIPVDRMLMFGWALAAAIGAVGGVIAAQYLGRLDFNLMAGVLLYGFAAATLGGFDSVKGAVVGGIIVGLTESLVPAFLSFIGPQLSLAMALLVILIVLSFKPEGLFGTKRVERV